MPSILPGVSIDSLVAENQQLRNRIIVLESELTAAQLGPFHASRLRRHFHRPTCEWAQAIAIWNLVEYGSHEQAVAAGLRPCKTCCA